MDASENSPFNDFSNDTILEDYKTNFILTQPQIHGLIKEFW